MNIRINNLTWKVKVVPLNDKGLKLDNGTECFGVANYVELAIYIGRVASKTQFRQTLIHELTHAFTFSYGIHLFADEHTEESICDFNGAHLDSIYSLCNRIMEGVYHA